MLRLVCDIETDGLLDECTRVHCAAAIDIDTGQIHAFRPYQIGKFVDLLRQADLIVFHNGIRFDLPALKKLTGWEPTEEQKVLDTLVWCRLVFPTDKLREDDFRRLRGGFPKKYIGSHALAAWGHRLGVLKDEWNDWSKFSEGMFEYLKQDIRVGLQVYEMCAAEEATAWSLDMEHAVATILARQERFGFPFDVKKARRLWDLLLTLKRKQEDALRQRFEPFVDTEVFVPKRNNKTKGYVKGEPFLKRKVTEFNPSSRDHIARALIEQRGWKPTEFTDTGKPKVSEEVLEGVGIPEASLIVRYLTVDKRLGQIANGQNAWLKLVQADGRIHGAVNTNGAVTGRMTHAYPNVAQVPAARSPLGGVCRSCFTAPDGWVLVGADAEGLELRCLAHFLAPYDKGRLVERLLKGDKKAGTDAHSMNAKALTEVARWALRKGLLVAQAGVDPSTVSFSREGAKTFLYGMIYGAGDRKLGNIIIDALRLGGLHVTCKRPVQLGKAGRGGIAKSLKGIDKLTAALARKVDAYGYIRGLDRRKVPIRSAHSALNTLLQGAGALIMKRALVILDERLQSSLWVAEPLTPDVDYEFCANVHDEWQIACRNRSTAGIVSEQAVKAICSAGEDFNFNCPLDGSADTGLTWKETH